MILTIIKRINKTLSGTSVSLDVFGRLEPKPATVLSEILTVSNNIFFGTQVKFFVSWGGSLKPRAHDVIARSTNRTNLWAGLGKHVRFWKELLMISYRETVATTKRW